MRDRSFYDIYRMTYNDDGTLVAVESNSGRAQYTWDGEIPHSRDELPSVRTPGRIELRLIGRTILDVDALGRPLRVWNVEKGMLSSRCEYVWTHTRFEAMQCHDDKGKPTWRSEAVYDCKTLPPIAPSVNRGGPPGI